MRSIITIVVAMLSVGCGLIITLIGLPIIGLAVLGGRAAGAMERARAAPSEGEHRRVLAVLTYLGV